MFELENKELCKVIPFCKSTDECTDIMDSGELIPDELCKQCLVKWLQSEVEG